MTPALTSMLAGLAAFVCVLSIAAALILPPRKRSPLELRLEAIARKGSSHKRSGDGGEQKSRRRHMEATLKSLETREREKRTRKASLRTELEQAGLEVAPRDFLTISAVIGAFTGLGTLILGLPFLLALGLGFSAGAGLPRFWLGQVKAGRQKKFINQFSDALDIMARGLKSGLPLNEGVRMVATESPDPVGAEFRSVLDAQSVGLPLEQALQRLHDRMPITEVAFFVIALQIQKQTGGNLSETLSNLAAVLRGRKQLKGKVGALSAEGRVSALIIGSLPVVVLGGTSAISPNYVSPLFTTPLGLLIFGVGVFWMLSGIFVMWRMISIKV